MTACPSCNSDDIEIMGVNREVSVPFGPVVTITETIGSCRACGMAGDFDGSNDASIVKARGESLGASVQTMIAKLVGSGISMAYLERALELPSRTVARWKSGEHSAAAIAILRTVTAIPWILEVAESGFDQAVVDNKTIESVGNKKACQQPSPQAYPLGVCDSKIEVATAATHHQNRKRTKMASALSIFSGLEIFMKYEPNAEVDAQHDVLYASGPKPEKLTEEDRTSLANLRWVYDATCESWRFT